MPLVIQPGEKPIRVLQVTEMGANVVAQVPGLTLDDFESDAWQDKIGAVVDQAQELSAMVPFDIIEVYESQKPPGNLHWLRANEDGFLEPYK